MTKNQALTISEQSPAFQEMLVDFYLANSTADQTPTQKKLVSDLSSYLKCFDFVDNCKIAKIKMVRVYAANNNIDALKGLSGAKTFVETGVFISN